MLVVPSAGLLVRYDLVPLAIDIDDLAARAGLRFLVVWQFKPTKRFHMLEVRNE